MLSWIQLKAHVRASSIGTGIAYGAAFTVLYVGGYTP